MVSLTRGGHTRRYVGRRCPWCGQIRLMRLHQQSCSARCARFLDNARMAKEVKHARASKAGRASGKVRHRQAQDRVVTQAGVDPTIVWAKGYETGYKNGWLVGYRRGRRRD